jgi:NAD-dependent SIR2 family protein deacetylase
MYSGGFYPFPDAETRWAWWARHIYYNRYIDPPKDVYGKLLALVQDKDYFVITTNVDHQFQRAGFDKKRLFYTQGDYGLFQSVNPSIRKTYDNEEWVILFGYPSISKTAGKSPPLLSEMVRQHAPA